MRLLSSCSVVLRPPVSLYNNALETGTIFLRRVQGYACLMKKPTLSRLFHLYSAKAAKKLNPEVDYMPHAFSPKRPYRWSRGPR